MLDQVLAQKKMREKFGAAETCSIAEKVWLAEMPDLAGKFSPRFIKNGIFQISVANSSTAAELRLAETIVLEALRKRGAKIKSVRYSVGLPEQILPF